MKSEIELKTLGSYQQEIKKHLPAGIFKRVPSRILFFVGFLCANIFLVYSIVHYDPAWYIKLLAACLIGNFNAGMAFFVHETLHGSVVKNKFLQDVIGFFGFSPFLVSPTYWRFWHNNLHHGNTQFIFKDPDAFPTLSVFKRSKFMRIVFKLSPGSGNFLSYFYLSYWFSFQSVLNQSYMRFKNKMWNDMDHSRVTIEFISLCLMAGGYLYWVKGENLLWLVLIPFAVQNYVILSYIITNHNLSPLTKINDPLVNSLTVTTNPFVDLIHLNFGYHVEHHLFPRVSPAHAKTLHKSLKELYPESYQYMPKWKALKYLYLTPRIYKNHEELIHPLTLETFPTLGPDFSTIGRTLAPNLSPASART